MNNKAKYSQLTLALMCGFGLLANVGCFSVDASGRRFAECDKLNSNTPKGWAEFHVRPPLDADQERLKSIRDGIMTLCTIRKKGDWNLFWGADSLFVIKDSSSFKVSYIRVAAEPGLAEFVLTDRSWTDPVNVSVPISKGMITPVEFIIDGPKYVGKKCYSIIQTIKSSPVAYTPGGCATPPVTIEKQR